jgi:hypothetical protein
MILDLFLLHVFHASSYCSFTSNLTMFSFIIDCWIDNGIYSAFITIIINLIIDKSRLCYKITIQYWQNVPYSQLYENKFQIKTSTKKIRKFYARRFFSGQNRKKVRKLREQIWYIYTNNCTVIRYGDIQTHGLPPTCFSLFQLSFREVFNKEKHING